MTWSAPRAAARSAFAGGTDGRDDGAAERLGDADGDGADAGAAGLHEDGFTRFQFGVVEQHVLDGGVGDAHAGGVVVLDHAGDRDGQARGVIDLLLREAVEVEASHAAGVLAQVLDALAAEPAMTADEGRVGDDAIADASLRHAFAGGHDGRDGFGADGQRQSALGEGHPAEAPDVDVIERHGVDAQRDLAGAGRRRRRHVDNGDLAVPEQAQCLHQRGPARTRQTFWPPKPNELDTMRPTSASRATLGTQSTGMAGSGVL